MNGNHVTHKLKLTTKAGTEMFIISTPRGYSYLLSDGFCGQERQTIELTIEFLCDTVEIVNMRKYNEVSFSE